jgi:hypothetical protein
MALGRPRLDLSMSCQGTAAGDMATGALARSSACETKDARERAGVAQKNASFGTCATPRRAPTLHSGVRPGLPKGSLIAQPLTLQNTGPTQRVRSVEHGLALRCVPARTSTASAAGNEEAKDLEDVTMTSRVDYTDG